MLKLEEFKTLTKARGFRNKIKPVDKALAEYLEAVATKPAGQAYPDVKNALNKLQTLRSACEQYGMDRPNSDRMGGVDQVMKLMKHELPALRFIVQAEDRTGAEAKRLLMQAREVTVDASRALSIQEFNPMEWLNSAIGCINSVKAGVVKKGETISEDMAGLVMDDIETLKNMSSNEEVPGVIRAMLKQITSSRIVSQISPGVNTPGAKFNETRGAGKKYTLNHRLVYDGGSRMRLGAIVHELTHVNVAEAFDHSVIMLAMPRDATDEDFLRVSRERKAKLQALAETLESDPEIGNEVFGRMGVKVNINTQIRYASSDKLTRYMSNLKPRLDAEEGKEFCERMTALNGQGLGAEIIEYDSVINQSLIWCHLHDVPETNPVYKQLATLAGENMVRRARAYPKPALAKPVRPRTPAPGRLPGAGVGRGPGGSGPGAPKPVWSPGHK